MINTDIIMQVTQVPCPKVFVGIITRNEQQSSGLGSLCRYTSHQHLTNQWMITHCTANCALSITLYCINHYKHYRSSPSFTK